MAEVAAVIRDLGIGAREGPQGDEPVIGPTLELAAREGHVGDLATIRSPDGTLRPGRRAGPKWIRRTGSDSRLDRVTDGRPTDEGPKATERGSGPTRSHPTVRIGSDRTRPDRSGLLWELAPAGDRSGRCRSDRADRTATSAGRAAQPAGRHRLAQLTGRRLNPRASPRRARVNAGWLRNDRRARPRRGTVPAPDRGGRPQAK